MNLKNRNILFFAAVLVVFAIISLSLSFFKSSTKKQSSTLFIGNSYTYRNKGVDQHLQSFLANANGIKNYYTRAAKGKYHLYTHWKDQQTLEKFEQRPWDKVVLQEFSKGPIVEPNAFFAYGKKWARKIKKKNKKAKIYLYATWCYKKRPTMTDSLSIKYNELAKEIDATVIPVGKMWQKVQQKMNLYDGDNAHPNRKGTFITACLFYEYLEGKDVRLTPHTDRKLPSWEQKKMKRMAHEFKVNYESSTKSSKQN